MQPSRAALLNDPTAAVNYGYNSGYPPSPTAVAVQDPQQLLHEREYLDRLVVQTSENLIDIFAPPMLAGAPSSMSITPSSRGEWYRNLLERTSPPAPAVEVPVLGEAKEVDADERVWLRGLLERGEDAVRELARVREVGALVVGLDMDM